MDSIKLLETILSEYAKADLLTIEKIEGGVTLYFKETLTAPTKKRTKKAKVTKAFAEAVVDESTIPDDLKAYYEILKTVGLHLQFFSHLSFIKQAWPDYELFKTFLGERKAWYEQKNSINENFHAYRAYLIKSVKGMIGV